MRLAEWIPSGSLNSAQVGRTVTLRSVGQVQPGGISCARDKQRERDTVPPNSANVCANETEFNQSRIKGPTGREFRIIKTFSPGGY